MESEASVARLMGEREFDDGRTLSDVWRARESARSEMMSETLRKIDKARRIVAGLRGLTLVADALACADREIMRLDRELAETRYRAWRLLYALFEIAERAPESGPYTELRAIACRAIERYTEGGS